jgi:hypothetical protein
MLMRFAVCSVVPASSTSTSISTSTSTGSDHDLTCLYSNLQDTVH